jgi:protein N-terminal amidase
MQIYPLPTIYAESKQPTIRVTPAYCLRIQPKSLDLLCFPEMAFSGYVFENATAITPYLEHPRTGTTSLFCSDLAKKLQCYVVAGFPEKLSPTEDRKTDQVGANSATFYGPDGEWVGGYRKSHLYETDLTWAKPGVGCSSSLTTLVFSIALKAPVSQRSLYHLPYKP